MALFKKETNYSDQGQPCLSFAHVATVRTKEINLSKENGSQLTDIAYKRKQWVPTFFSTISCSFSSARTTNSFSDFWNLSNMFEAFTFTSRAVCHLTWAVDRSSFRILCWSLRSSTSILNVSLQQMVTSDIIQLPSSKHKSKRGIIIYCRKERIFWRIIKYLTPKYNIVVSKVQNITEKLQFVCSFVCISGNMDN